jgi:hypothetical protein
MLLFGPSFVFRPITLVLLLGVGVLLVWIAAKGFLKKEEAEQ